MSTDFDDRVGRLESLTKPGRAAVGAPCSGGETLFAGNAGGDVGLMIGSWAADGGGDGGGSLQLPTLRGPCRDPEGVEGSGRAGPLGQARVRIQEQAYRVTDAMSKWKRPRDRDRSAIETSEGKEGGVPWVD